MSRIDFRALETRRIRLELPTAAHVDGIFASFASDSEVTRFLMWPPARTREDCEESMARRSSRIASGEEFSWILVLRESNEVFGSLSLWPRPDGTEIGFALARASWGQGLAVEAGQVAMGWAKESLGLNRIWGSCDPENLRSVRVLEKLGLSEAKLQRANKIRPNLSSEPRDSRIFEIVVVAE